MRMPRAQGAACFPIAACVAQVTRAPQIQLRPRPSSSSRDSKDRTNLSLQAVEVVVRNSARCLNPRAIRALQKTRRASSQSVRRSQGARQALAPRRARREAPSTQAIRRVQSPASRGHARGAQAQQTRKSPRSTYHREIRSPRRLLCAHARSRQALEVAREAQAQAECPASRATRQSMPSQRTRTTRDRVCATLPRQEQATASHRVLDQHQRTKRSARPKPSHAARQS